MIMIRISFKRTDAFQTTAQVFGADDAPPATPTVVASVGTAHVPRCSSTRSTLRFRRPRLAKQIGRKFWPHPEPLRQKPENSAPAGGGDEKPFEEENQITEASVTLLSEVRLLSNDEFQIVREHETVG
jgi:hypothetical protein